MFHIEKQLSSDSSRSVIGAANVLQGLVSSYLKLIGSYDLERLYDNED